MEVFWLNTGSTDNRERFCFAGALAEQPAWQFRGSLQMPVMCDWFTLIRPPQIMVIPPKKIIA